MTFSRLKLIYVLYELCVYMLYYTYNLVPDSQLVLQSETKIHECHVEKYCS
jgi:hypothetical protein